MDFMDFLVVVAAVFVGGLMLTAFLWAAVKITSLEKSGFDVPAKLVLMVTIPPLIVVAALWNI